MIKTLEKLGYIKVESKDTTFFAKHYGKFICYMCIKNNIALSCIILNGTVINLPIISNKKQLIEFDKMNSENLKQ